MMREVFPFTSYFQFPGYQANRSYGVRIGYPRQLCFCQSESVESEFDGSLNFITVPQSLHASEKEAKAAVSAPNSKKLRAIARVIEVGSDGQRNPVLLYLLDIGMDMDQIKSMTSRHPGFAYYSLEGKIKPVVKFLLDVGVNLSDIPRILRKCPQLCGISLTENLIPTMTHLENLGVDKEKWAKVIYRCPGLLTLSRQKLQTTVDYFYELGLTAERVGKTLTRCPSIMNYSVEESLRPKAKYFRSLGVDVAVLLHRAPQVLCLSIEGNLKPTTEFFLEKGFSIEEVGAMISRNAVLYNYSLVENLIPKWEFFLTTDYPTSDLVKFPQYFGYSLEKRIKPRYAQVRECGVNLAWNQILIVSEPDFEKLLKRKIKMKKKLDELGSNMEESTFKHVKFSR